MQLKPLLGVAIRGEILRSQKIRKLRERHVGTLGYLLCLLPVAVAFVYVREYGVNAPYNDGITLIPLFEKLFAGELGWSDLFAQHNEHRIFFPRIALLLLGLITDFNDVAAMYSIQACLLVTTLVLLLVFRDTMSRSPWLFLPVPFLTFNLGQSWNMLQGFQLTLVFVQTFVILSFALLHLSSRARSTPRIRLSFAGALFAGVIATFSSAPGLLVWPLGMLQIALFSVSRRSKTLMASIWSVTGSLGWALYLYGYESSETTSWRGTLEHKRESLEYFVSALGASLFHGRLDLALASGILLASLLITAVLFAYRTGQLREDSFWLVALLFALLTIGATTLARGATPEDALNPKYVTYTVLAPIAGYAMLARSLCIRRESVNLSALVILAVLAVVGLALSYPQGISEAREIAEDKRRTAFALSTYESQPDEILASSGVLRERFRTDPEESRRLAEFLEGHEYSVFSGPRSGVLPPPLSDPTPGRTDHLAGSRIAGEVDARMIHDGSGSKRFLLVTGWASGSGSERVMKGVYVVLDGKPYPAFYGARSSERLHGSGVRYSGFERAIPISEIGSGSGEHELSVVATTARGESYVDVGSKDDIQMNLRFNLR